MLKQINRKSLVYLGLIIVIFLFALSLIYFFSQGPRRKKEEKLLPAEKTFQEVIQDLTAPVEEKEIPSVPKEVIKELSAPEASKQNYRVPEEIIKNLTSPE